MSKYIDNTPRHERCNNLDYKSIRRFVSHIAWVLILLVLAFIGVIFYCDSTDMLRNRLDGNSSSTFKAASITSSEFRIDITDKDGIEYLNNCFQNATPDSSKNWNWPQYTVRLNYGVLRRAHMIIYPWNDGIVVRLEPDIGHENPKFYIVPMPSPRPASIDLMLGMMQARISRGPVGDRASEEKGPEVLRRNTPGE